MVRRSSRSRQHPKSSYDEELQNLAEKKNRSSRREIDSDASDTEKEVEEAMKEEDESMMETDNEEEFSPKKPKATPPSLVVGKRAGQRILAVKLKAQSKKTLESAKSGGSKNKRSIQAALSALAKKVLDPSETPQTSLMAALLDSAKPTPDLDSSSIRSSTSRPVTMYTAQLVSVARRLLQDHEPNSMHIQLLNLLFRSVGGSYQTNIKDGTDLEELDDNEWDNLVTEVVQVMRDSDLELLTANPDDKLGTREYRAIYHEFWYRLGTVILSFTPVGQVDDQEGPTASSSNFTSNRFQVELMRDLISRMTELVLVGQPDLRAAATTAVWELAKASTERTVELTAKLDTAQRQHTASKGQSRKLQALEHSMDTWKRHKTELEVVVEEAVIQGVFIRRYRDSNPHIRRESLDALRDLILLRPDIFLKDKYLKYLGWMASDKDATVRLAALKGLLAPFKYNQDKRPTSLQFDVQSMQNVCRKFLPRIADCTDDSQSLEVQEISMELIVKLANEGFLDDWDDDAGWDRLNLKALDATSTHTVRKNALYLILDQLDCFDDAGHDARSRTSVTPLSERQLIVRIEAVARWIAHLLTDGTIEINKIKVELADHVVKSLRDMPEHKDLTTSWTAILKAVGSESPQQSRREKEEIAKTAVLLRMLACSAELEATPAELGSNKKRKQDGHASTQKKEALSQALLKNLPGLLTSFNSDHMSMRSLTKLPQYILPEVFCLSTRKSDFTALVKNLCVSFLETTDEGVLHEIAKSLSLFVQGNHARVADVKGQLKRISTAMQDRLMELFAESDPNKETAPTPKKQRRLSRSKSSRRSDGSTTSGTLDSFQSQEHDVEHSISLCLLRWKVFLKVIPVSMLFEESEDDDENVVDGFFMTISEAIGKRLLDRKPTADADDAQTESSRSATTAGVWMSGDTNIHAEVAKVIDRGLDVLLCIVAWRLADLLNYRKENFEVGVVDDDGDDVPQSLRVAKLRDVIAKLIGLCYEQFLEPDPHSAYSEEQERFASSVQTSAGRVASDLRTLFPREWSSAKDPSLRALAMTDDSHLIGGFVRFLHSRADEFDDKNAKNELSLVRDLIVPVARALAANWTQGNRKEAGVILSHLIGSGKLVGQTVHHLARLLKKIHPVRFLESQMAALLMAFKAWLDGEPEELNTDRPSEEEMHQYELAEKQHQALFHAAEQLASRLSMTLGVGTISDNRLSQALLNFMQEGIRFSFEGDANVDDDLLLGTRLPFLTILSKYSTWIRKNKSYCEVLGHLLFAKESALRSHPDFDEVHEDDLRCIRDFQESLGLTASKMRRLSQELPKTLDVSHDGTVVRTTATPGSTARSIGSRRPLSAAGSQRSGLSVQSNLSPLMESPEDRETDAGNDSPSPQKRRRLTNSLPELNESAIADDESANGSDY